MYTFNIIIEIKDRLTFENFRQHLVEKHDSKLHFWYECIDCETFFRYRINIDIKHIFYLGVLWQQYRDKFGL